MATLDSLLLTFFFSSVASSAIVSGGKGPRDWEAAMILGTYTVIDTVISDSATAYYSGSEFYDLLSQGERLAVHVIVDSAGTRPVTLTFTVDRSNNGAIWKELFTTTFTVAALDPLPWNDYADVGLMITTGQLGSKTRVSINSSEDMVKVKIIVAVRG